MPDRPTYASEESVLFHLSVEQRLDALEKLAIDHAQRFDTLQTPWWRRILMWFDGWPWYDLNGERKPRPWKARFR